MIRIQFNNSKSMLTAEFTMISKDIVQLEGKKIKANRSGFKAYRLNGKLLGDYSDYTEIIKEEEGCVQFGKGTV